jgi:lysophospholipase L1-like esterase
MTPYKLMLQTIRKAHPDTPILSLTPITSVREVQDEAYSKRSLHDRTVMREAVSEFTKAGGKNIILVEGEDLLGFKEHEGLSKDGVHPNDQGYAVIAKKLRHIMQKALGL